MKCNPRRRSSGRRLWRWVETLLWLAAMSLLGYTAYFYARGWYVQELAEATLHGERVMALPTERPLKEGALVGRLEIPDVGLSVIAFEGATDDILSYGVGHLPESAPPGTKGNAVFAA